MFWCIGAIVWVTPALFARIALQPTAPTSAPGTATERAGQEPGASDQTASVPDAIRLANQTLDRLEAVADPTRAEELLSETNRHIQVVQTKDPSNAWLGYFRARMLIRMGHPGEAIDLVRQFIETRDGRNSWQAHRLLGDLLVIEFPRLAKASYEQAARLNPNASEVLLGLSACAVKLGDLDEAVRLGREAVAADGHRSVRPRSHLAGVLKAAGRWEESLTEARGALELAQTQANANPGNPTSLVALDAQYQLLIEITQARLTEAAAQPRNEPASPPEQVAAQYVRLAGYLRDRAQVSQQLAAHAVARALETGVNRTAPQTPVSLLEQYAVALAEAGRTDDAVKVFKQLQTKDPNHALAAEWLQRLLPKPADPEVQETP